MSTYADRLADLNAAVESARQRSRAAEARRRREADAIVGPVRPLIDYRDDVDFNRRSADLGEAQRLTRDLCERVIDGDLVFEAVASLPGALIVRDPSVQAEAESAREAYDRATVERGAFVRRHGDDLQAERDAAEMGRLREAIAGDDPTALRRALAAEG